MEPEDLREYLDKKYQGESASKFVIRGTATIREINGHLGDFRPITYINGRVLFYMGMLSAELRDLSHEKVRR